MSSDSVAELTPVDMSYSSSTGEQDLIVAIIMQAISDKASPKHDERYGAIVYLESESFDWHCSMLGLSAEQIRKGI